MFESYFEAIFSNKKPSFKLTVYALNEIAINPLAGDQVPTINETDLNKQAHRKKTSFGTRSSLQGFTFVSQKIKTEPGETNIESIQKSMEDEKAAVAERYALDIARFGQLIQQQVKTNRQTTPN